MEDYAGIDVSLELSSVCVVDAKGMIVKEAKVASEHCSTTSGTRTSSTLSCPHESGSSERDDGRGRPEHGGSSGAAESGLPNLRPRRQ